MSDVLILLGVWAVSCAVTGVAVYCVLRYGRDKDELYDTINQSYTDFDVRFTELKRTMENSIDDVHRRIDSLDTGLNSEMVELNRDIMGEVQNVVASVESLETRVERIEE
jgi:hypothetical protein